MSPEPPPHAGCRRVASGQSALPRGSVEPGSARPSRPTSTACAWCGAPVIIKPRGRLPRWCSETCRHRAWELDRAAATGRAAVEIVERIVEVTHERTITRDVEVTPTGTAWVSALHTLATELDHGKIYDRDLPAMAVALSAVLDAYHRRPATRRHNR